MDIDFILALADCGDVGRYPARDGGVDEPGDDGTGVGPLSGYLGPGPPFITSTYGNGPKAAAFRRKARPRCVGMGRR